ncbi:hypothetical protein D9619_002269 [Psilocybe cf. subviscida]|uniref:Uncharacterized protein n=1 Tax=Psilocybe cf. subviscida TaxID=2480587 RepID=A0A8H5BGG3_9AGAR|nr:hypothetical protein D9619_002269 [Psilocybe cf. subviscida]
MADAPVHPSTADKGDSYVPSYHPTVWFDAFSTALTPLLVVITLLHAVALFSTTYRLAHRFRIRRLWWDDYASIVPLVFNVYYLYSIWSKSLQLRMNSPAETTRQLYDSYWLTILPFLVILWISRAVQASTLVRVFWRRHAARRVALSVVSAMIICFVVSVLVNFLTCKSGANLLPSVPGRVVNCSTGEGLEKARKGIMLAIDALGSSVLVIAPIYFLLRVRLKDSSERRLIFVLLWGGILAMLVVILFIIMVQTGLLRAHYPNVMLHVEASAAICISNLSIISTCLYSTLLGSRPPPSRSSRSRSSRSHPRSQSQSHSNPQSHSHSASTASSSRCLCHSRSDATEESSKVTIITLTEYSEFGSIPVSQYPPSIGSGFTNESSRNLMHWSASDDKHSEVSGQRSRGSLEGPNNAGSREGASLGSGGSRTHSTQAHPP